MVKGAVIDFNKIMPVGLPADDKPIYVKSGEIGCPTRDRIYYCPDAPRRSQHGQITEHNSNTRQHTKWNCLLMQYCYFMLLTVTEAVWYLTIANIIYNINYFVYCYPAPNQDAMPATFECVSGHNATKPQNYSYY